MNQDDGLALRVVMKNSFLANLKRHRLESTDSKEGVKELGFSSESDLVEN